VTPNVDAHQHFWHVARRDYAWLTAQDYPQLYRDFEPQDLAPLLDQCGIEKTILVQGAQTEDETAFLLAMAATTEFVAGVVGWTDLLATDAAARVARMAAQPKLVGLRPMLEMIEDDDWMLDTKLTAGLHAMAACGLTFDALIRPRHLPRLKRFLERYPDLPVVIDHAAKPDIAGREIDAWARDMREVAANSDACVKLSGMATEAEPDWDRNSLEPYVEVLFEGFGAERIMWGSDWPVLNVAGDYAGWRRTSDELAAALTAPEREWIFGRTAATFYGIPGDDI